MFFFGFGADEDEDDEDLLDGLKRSNRLFFSFVSLDVASVRVSRGVSGVRRCKSQGAYRSLSRC